MLHGAETWVLDRQQVNRLLATEMDVWLRAGRKSRKLNLYCINEAVIAAQCPATS